MSYEFVGKSGLGDTGSENSWSWEDLACLGGAWAPSCLFVRANETMDQSHETLLARNMAQEASFNADAQRSEQAAAAANAGRSEAEFNEVKNQLGTSIVSAVPFLVAASIIGLGVIGYLLWRSSRQQIQYLPAPQYEYEVEQLEGVE